MTGLQISDKTNVLKAIEHVQTALGNEQNWTKTGEAMTRQGQPTSPTSNDARQFSLTGAIKRGVQQVQRTENWTAAKAEPFEQEVERVFSTCLSEQGYQAPTGQAMAEGTGINPAHPEEQMLYSFNASAGSFAQVSDLISTARERVINYSE